MFWRWFCWETRHATFKRGDDETIHLTYRWRPWEKGEERWKRVQEELVASGWKQEFAVCFGL